MSKTKLFLAIVALLTGSAAWAQSTDGLIVRSGDTLTQFAISDIKEITFSDSGISVIKADDVAVSFGSDWLIQFAQIDDTAIRDAIFSGSDAPAQVFNAEGKLIKETTLSEIGINSLPKGVYIIKTNGKCLKIMR